MRRGLAALSIAMAGVGCGIVHAQSLEPVQPALYKDSRRELARARARGDTVIVLAMAARRGKGAHLARAARQLGGAVRFEDDDVDYLRVRVPIENVDQLLTLPSLEAAAIRLNVEPRATPSASGAGAGARSGCSSVLSRDAATATWPPPPSRYPMEHPYSPLRDLDAETFRAEHPTWDGRGVTIADLELTPDLLAPELQGALALDGSPVPKIIDVVNAVDPEDNNNPHAALWLRMRTVVTSQAGVVSYQGRTYRAPYDGVFRIDLFDSRYVDGIHEGLSACLGPDSLFAVLWDEKTNRVWVDTDQARDFTRARSMTDYTVGHDVGVLGRDDPRTSSRESVGFTVQTDRTRHFLALNLGVGGHASMVGGAAAGSRGSDGHYDGVAPAARLVSINYGADVYGVVEALIRGFKDPRIDVVLYEPNVNEGAAYRVGDGRYVTTLIAARLVARYRKPLVIPGGNSIGFGLTSGDATDPAILSIGAYQSGESYRVNLGIRAKTYDNLHLVGSGGPAGNGAVKPDVLAPSDVLSSRFGPVRGDGVQGLFELPPGYTIAGGTSTAAPIAAGALALLISAAKQSGVPYDASSLRRALLRTARPLPNLPAYEQGNGLLQVAAAWQALKGMGIARSGAKEPITIISEGPIHTATSRWLRSPNSGVGLLEQEGWTIGQREDRTVTFTRTTGPKEPVRLAIRWTGNDGTFATATTVTLPLGKPIRVSVAVAPATLGAHSALLDLVRPGDSAPVYRVECAIVAAYQFTAPGFTVTVHDSLPRPGRKTLFFAVPPHTGALVVDVAATSHTAVAFWFHRPDGRWLPRAWTTETSGRGVVYLPEPGIWQLTFEQDRDKWFEDQEGDHPLPPIPLVVTAAALAADIELPDTNGAASTWRANVRNQSAAFTGAVVTSAVGSAHTAHETLATGEQRAYRIDVPPGSTMLLARLSSVSDRSADLDLYLFDCTGSDCLPAADATGGRAELAYPAPKAGKWVLVVDAARASTRAVSFEALNVVLNPQYGTLAAADVPTSRPTAAQWTAAVNVWRAAPVPTGRRPIALLAVGNSPMSTGQDRDEGPDNSIPVSWRVVPLATQ